MKAGVKVGREILTPTNRQAVIELRDVSHGFGRTPNELLDQVNLTVHRGECVAVRGDNGQGKSTIVRLVKGILVPRRGEVRTFGIPVSGRDHMPGIGHVGEMPQVDAANALPPELAVYEVMRTARELLRLAGNDLSFGDQLARELGLDALGVRCKLVGQLSKGWRTRLITWLALAKQPQALLLDEPFEGLDDETRPALAKALRATVDRGETGILFISHHYHEIARMADRVFELRDRKLHLRGELAFHCTVGVNGESTAYRALTGRDLLNVLSDALLSAATRNLEVSATVVPPEKEVNQWTHAVSAP